MPEIIYSMEQIGIPILSLLFLIPLAGALVLLFFPDNMGEKAKSFAMLVTILDFLLSLCLLFYFKAGSSALQFVEQSAWIPSIGAEYLLGIDGISIFLVLLTTFLGPITILSTYGHIKERIKEFMICILLLQAAVLGVFISLDLLLFYFFWEAMLLPMALIIGIWGGKRRIYSSYKFFLYTLVGSFPMILGILGIYINYHNWAVANNISLTYTFNLLKLYSVPVNPAWQTWIFLALFLGFAVKVPMFPFHSWLPDAHTDAPTAGSVILAGVLLKMGTYGFVRIGLCMLPLGVDRCLDGILFLAGFAILYGAWVALLQDDVKKLVAYSSVSHMAYIILGTFALNRNGVMGGVLQNINHGLSTGGLFLLVGMIYDRRHTRMISDFGGLFKQLPVYTTFFALIMFSSMGVPGMNGFIGEFLILAGAWQATRFYTVIGILGILACLAYLLWMFQRVFLGEITNPENSKLSDLNTREIVILVPIVVMCFVIGLYPKPFINTIQPSVDKLLTIMDTNRDNVLVVNNAYNSSKGSERINPEFSHLIASSSSTDFSERRHSTLKEVEINNSSVAHLTAGNL